MNLNLIVIRSSNIEKLANFYSKLGLEFEFHQHGEGPFHYSSKLENLVFEIYPLQKNQPEVDNSLRLGFSVKNLDEFIKSMEDIELVKPPTLSEFGYFAIIKDIEGRKIELTEK